MKRMLIIAGSLILALVLTGCATGVPKGLVPVEGFDLGRYLGRWYEIARLDHSFERGLIGVTADYELIEPGVVRVTNRGFKPGQAEPEIAIGKARLPGPPTRGSLKVSFFGPFYAGYHIIALDQDGYQYAMVAGPTRGYLWILCRSPQMDDKVFERLVDQARTAGFATDQLIRVTHDRQENLTSNAHK